MSLSLVVEDMSVSYGDGHRVPVTILVSSVERYGVPSILPTDIELTAG